MCIYILYRKTIIGDGDHEATDRIYTTTDLLNIFSESNYDVLNKYESKHKFEFFYFVLTVELNQITDDDDGYLFWNPKERSYDMFQGPLKKFKKIVDNPNTVYSEDEDDEDEDDEDEDEDEDDEDEDNEDEDNILNFLV